MMAAASRSSRTSARTYSIAFTWKDDRNVFFCPCHDGVFSVDGEVISGPPPRPLDQFETKVENGQISILLS